MKPIPASIVEAIKRACAAEGINADEYLDHLRAPCAPVAGERDAALEEAAKMCEAEICDCCWDDDAKAAAEHIAARIRALKSRAQVGT